MRKDIARKAFTQRVAQMPSVYNEKLPESWKPPKQFKHWLTKLNLLPPRMKRSDNQFITALMHGRGRNWRVNCYNEFQMSDPYEDFDRWANSVASTFEWPFTKNFPETFEQFKNIITIMENQ